MSEPIVYLTDAADPRSQDVFKDMVAVTSPQRQFLGQFEQWLKRPEVEGRVSSVYVDGRCVGAAMGWTQKRKRGIWGRYFNLVFAYVSVPDRRQKYATLMVNTLLDDARSAGADRLKSLAGSRLGFLLHEFLNHTMWGLDEHGHMVIDHPLTEEQRALSGVPNNVSNLRGAEAQIVDGAARYELFRTSPKGRRCPATWVLDGCMDTGEGYEIVPAHEVVALKSTPGLVTRWAEKGSKMVTSPLNALEAHRRLENLICFRDVRAELPSYYAAARTAHPLVNPLAWRVYQCRSGL